MRLSAASKGHEHIVQLLLEKKASPHIKSHNGRSGTQLRVLSLI